MPNKFDAILREYERRFPRLVSAAAIAREAQGEGVSAAYISQMRRGGRNYTPQKAAIIGATVADLVGASDESRRIIVAEFEMAADKLPDLAEGETVVRRGDRLEIEYVRDDDESAVLSSYRGVSTHNPALAKHMLDMMREMERSASIGGRIASSQGDTNDDSDDSGKAQR